MTLTRTDESDEASAASPPDEAVPFQLQQTRQQPRGWQTRAHIEIARLPRFKAGQHRIQCGGTRSRGLPARDIHCTEGSPIQLFQHVVGGFHNPSAVPQECVPPLFRPLSTLPGTASTSRPCPKAQRAVISDPLLSPASTTTTARQSPLIIRFRNGKNLGCGRSRQQLAQHRASRRNVVREPLMLRWIHNIGSGSEHPDGLPARGEGPSVYSGVDPAREAADHDQAARGQVRRQPLGDCQGIRRPRARTDDGDRRPRHHNTGGGSTIAASIGGYAALSHPIVSISAVRATARAAAARRCNVAGYADAARLLSEESSSRSAPANRPARRRSTIRAGA